MATSVRISQPNVQARVAVQNGSTRSAPARAIAVRGLNASAGASASLSSRSNGIAKARSVSMQSASRAVVAPTTTVAGLFDAFAKKGASGSKVKTVIITGASSGLGLAATRSLINTEDWHVIMACRDVEKAKAIAAEEGFPKSSYTVMELELGSLSSVRKFVKNFRRTGKTLDVLCCNAAIYLPNQPGPTYTEDGFEESVGVNHLSHFLLCNMMIPDLKKAMAPRCIIVGSITGNTNTVGGGAVKPFADLGNLEGLNAGLREPVCMIDGKAFDGAKAYKDSKLANMMTVLQLHERFHKETGIVFSSLYPGCIAETGLFRQKRTWFRKFFPVFMKYVTGGYVSEEEAGDRLMEVVASPAASKSGVYWSWNGGARTVGFYDPKTKQVRGAGGSGGELFENKPSTAVRDPIKGKKLWDMSAKLVGLNA